MKASGGTDYILIYYSDKPDDYTKFTLSADKNQLIQPKQIGGTMDRNGFSAAVD